MKLVLIYGPPGVGKMTVAKTLAKLTGYRALHTHLIVDATSSVFPVRNKKQSILTEQIRLKLIRAAIHNNVSGLIVTFAYGSEHADGIRSDNRVIKKMVRIVGKEQGSLYFVKLECARQVWYRRIRHPDRKSFGKICTVKHLTLTVEKDAMRLVIPFAENLIIDNTYLSPLICAKKIKAHYEL